MANKLASNRPVPGTLQVLKPAATAASHGSNAARAIQTAVAKNIHIFNGTGVPGSVGQVAGDLFFRTDTPSVTNQRLYTYDGTAWIPIL